MAMTCLDDFEDYARRHLPKIVYDYYSSGANLEQTVKDNVAAFRRLRLYPELLQDVSKRDLSTTILGEKIDFPVAIAPTAMQKMAHPHGEVATAKAAASVNTGMVLSSWATSSIEEVQEAAPDGLRWFQLYVYKDRELTKNLVKRAEKAGYRALFLTVDTPQLGRRYADVKNNFTLPPPLNRNEILSNLSINYCVVDRLANFEDQSSQSEGVVSSGDSGLAEYVANQIDASLSWDDVEWLKTVTTLPIVLKGILTEEDAVEAVNHGVAGIVVSNHGGRQLDGVLATIDALPEVVRAVKGSSVEVYLDGGVRLGTDVLKALALGARAVFIGRPVLWGLTYKGEAGVKEVLDMLKNEFNLALALSGCTSAENVPRDLVRRQPQYSSNL
ncbi:Hydroxyacid oxidase 1 [Holothuria leucospilota]|uniref:(S)-2-hydroxy-acid oxidase n=1 Tax=Holothuria leucospilota TaxID=206669 RepID=A0A9Q1CGI7_HOLLE|nr:Hydroxyacid oxidase 1 [Holothuria leucospilota]